MLWQSLRVSCSLGSARWPRRPALSPLHGRRAQSFVTEHSQRQRGRGSCPPCRGKARESHQCSSSRTVRMLAGSRRGSPPAVSHTRVAWGRAPCSVASGDSVGRGTWGWRGCCTARLRSPVPGGMLSQSQWQTVVSKSLIYSGNYQLARVPFSR